ncbi:hypothetical protein IU510_30155 [Nocardia cyriacigeorgica]|uniref:hypothetical protein n=1 Tax=Nocardia TaxID=1817 RepID=UPI0018953788|nr:MULTISPECIES: hypothetical protein [Nocardia]MBF6102285.1 hypothetical protein [Nocardia cyriacigeorgica]
MDTAIAVLNLTVSESETADRAALAELAAWHGCHITDVVTIDDQTFMPTTLIAHTAHTVRASAILAPSLAHFGTAAKALTVACTLVVPATVIPRRPG